MPSVLFVCTANICRSPMAMSLFKARLGEEAIKWKVESAGTWALEGEPAASRVHQVLGARGLDISQHHSRRVNREMLESFNLILTMEQGQKEALQAEFRDLYPRFHLLSEVAGLSHNIHDPIGGLLADYQAAADEIDRLLSLGFEKICLLAKTPLGSVL